MYSTGDTLPTEGMKNWGDSYDMKFHLGFLQNSYSWVTHCLLSDLKSYSDPWDPKAQRRALYHEPMMQNVARVVLIA